MNSCARHQDVAAAFWCPRCAALLCAACTAERVYSSTRVTVDTACGDMVHPWAPATASRRGTHSLRPLTPFWTRPAELAAYPFQSPGPTMLVIWGAWFWLFGALTRQTLPIFTLLAVVIAHGTFYSYCFMLLRRSAAGDNTVPVPHEFLGFGQDAAGPFLRLVIACAPIWLPLIILQFISPSSNLILAAVENPALALVSLYGLLAFPMSVMMAAQNHRFIALLNPIFVIGYALRIPRAYLMSLLYVAGLVTANIFLVYLLLVRLPEAGFAFPFSLAAEIILVYPKILIFRILGVMIFEEESVLEK